MQRDLGNGYELDDDPARIDREAVHRYLSGEAYWALGRPREVVDETLDTAARVVGLYHEDQQIGFVRIVSDRHTVAYVADVYVLPEHRGRGIYTALVAKRLADARADGRTAAVIQAVRSTSAPIAAKLGFREMCGLEFYAWEGAPHQEIPMLQLAD